MRGKLVNKPGQKMTTSRPPPIDVMPQMSPFRGIRDTTARPPQNAPAFYTAPLGYSSMQGFLCVHFLLEDVWLATSSSKVVPRRVIVPDRCIEPRDCFRSGESPDAH